MDKIQTKTPPPLTPQTLPPNPGWDFSRGTREKWALWMECSGEVLLLLASTSLGLQLAWGTDQSLPLPTLPFPVPHPREMGMGSGIRV